MDNANFQQTGGFPLETDTLNFMQNTYKLFNDFGAAIGEKTIVKGCTLAGSTVSNGAIYLNGELIEFRGGLQQSKIIVREEVILITEFKDGTTKDVYKKRYAQFGTGVNAINWSEFKRIDPIILMMAKITELEKKTAIFQAGGGMFFWNKPANEIPAGYQEVVDWRGRMPVGWDASQTEFDTLGKTGGEKSVTLTEPQLPKHTPTGKTTYSGNHSHQYDKEDPSGDGNNNGSEDGWSIFYTANTSSAGNHRHNLDADEIGNDEAHNNLSPYRVVLFIEYID